MAKIQFAQTLIGVASNPVIGPSAGIDVHELVHVMIQDGPLGNAKGIQTPKDEMNGQQAGMVPPGGPGPIGGASGFPGGPTPSPLPGGPGIMAPGPNTGLGPQGLQASPIPGGLSSPPGIGNGQPA